MRTRAVLAMPVLSAVLWVLLAGCRPPAQVDAGAVPPAGGRPATELYRDLFERALSHGDTGALVRAVAPVLVLHIANDSLLVPRAGVFRIAQSITGAFPDVQFHVDDVVAEGARSAVRLHFTGTHRGTWHGIAATGRAIYVTEMFTCRAEQDRLRECWQEWDEAGLQRQLTR